MTPLFTTLNSVLGIRNYYKNRFNQPVVMINNSVLMCCIEPRDQPRNIVLVQVRSKITNKAIKLLANTETFHGTANLKNHKSCYT